MVANLPIEILVLNAKAGGINIDSGATANIKHLWLNVILAQSKITFI